MAGAKWQTVWQIMRCTYVGQTVWQLPRNNQHREAYT